MIDKKELKAIASKLTDCFATLAMTPNHTPITLQSNESQPLKTTHNIIPKKNLPIQSRKNHLLRFVAFHCIRPNFPLQSSTQLFHFNYGFGRKSASCFFE